jgi:hypothetical protein
VRGRQFQELSIVVDIHDRRARRLLRQPQGDAR